MRSNSMVKQNIWIAITIGVFVAGIGISYGVFSSSQVMPSSMMMSPQQMKQMMHDPDFRNDWANLMIQDTIHMKQMMQYPDFRNEVMEVMIADTDHMNQWMQDDPQHIPLMIEKMKVNHDFMMGMALPMIQDPGLRLQVLGHMTESPDAMTQMQQMMGGMMEQGMMSSETMKEMMEDPEIRHEMIELMSTHTTEMQELLSSELSDEEFDTKMIELMEKHQHSMSALMQGESMDHNEHP